METAKLSAIFISVPVNLARTLSLNSLHSFISEIPKEVVQGLYLLCGVRGRVVDVPGSQV